METPLHKVDVKPQEEPPTRAKSETPVGFVPDDPIPVSDNPVPVVEVPNVAENKSPSRQMNTAPQENNHRGLDSAPKPQPKKPVDDWAVPSKEVKNRWHI